MNSFIRYLCAAVLVACTAGLSSAAVIFDNDPPDGLNAWPSDYDYGVQLADDFVLQPGGATITDAHWWGVYSTSDSATEPDNFTLRVFADASGTPGAMLHSRALGDPGRTDTGVDLGATYDIYEYNAFFAPIALTPGTTYWLSIVNDTAADTDDDWSWNQSHTIGNGHYRLDDAQVVWFPFSSDLAFQLTGDSVAAVPEPAALAFWLVGLACGARSLCRRRIAASDPR